jgi:hypothetical protein
VLKIGVQDAPKIIPSVAVAIEERSLLPEVVFDGDAAGLAVLFGFVLSVCAKGCDE